MPPTLVVTDQVQSMEFHNQVTLIGRTEPRSYSRIIAEVAGRVTQINADEGNAIEKGHPLVSISPERTAFDLEAKEAEVARARTQIALAESNRKAEFHLFDASRQR